MTKFYYHNIKCATKTKEIQKQYSHYKVILKLWKDKRVNVKYQITSRQRRSNKINKMIFKWIRKNRKINAADNFIKKKQIHHDMKAIVKYIIFDFKNVVNNDYKNRTIFISLKLKNVEFKRKDERLIKNVLKIIFSENEYVLSLSIRSTLLFNKKITTSLKKSLMNVFNTFTSFFRIVRFIFSKFV